MRDNKITGLTHFPENLSIYRANDFYKNPVNPVKIVYFTHKLGSSRGSWCVFWRVGK